MKMVQNTKCRFILLAILSFFIFDGVCQDENYTISLERITQINKNWEDIEFSTEYNFEPQSEKQLIQLHLLNVISYLESQSLNELTEEQRDNRDENINLLRRYTENGEFPVNTFSEDRLPIFIDEENRYCAVGFLLKETGSDKIAREIAGNQLLSYLEEINHPELGEWQKNSGLTSFELTLIQPTYGPPIPVCASPSPIEWRNVTDTENKISQFFESNNSTAFYGVSPANDLNLEVNLKRFSAKTYTWKTIGNTLYGQITEFAEVGGDVYLAVVLPLEAMPHQILKLKNNKWEKIAHFNGAITGMKTLNDKLYVTGNFTKANELVGASFVEIHNDEVKKFTPFGLKTYSYDNMVASKTALFLTSNGGIYKLKNDTLSYIGGIKYYNYIKNISLDAVDDTVYVSSASIQGYFAYHTPQEKTVSINNMLQGRDFPYQSVNFTKSKMIDGNMLTAGDFRTSTLVPQMNDERYLVRCEESQSQDWFGEGLLYQQGRNFYPILEKGTVMDFIEINNHLYILLNDGTIHSASLNEIKGRITSLQKKKTEG